LQHFVAKQEFAAIGQIRESCNGHENLTALIIIVVGKLS